MNLSRKTLFLRNCSRYGGGCLANQHNKRFKIFFILYQTAIENLYDDTTMTSKFTIFVLDIG